MQQELDLGEPYRVTFSARIFIIFPYGYYPAFSFNEVADFLAAALLSLLFSSRSSLV